MASFFDWDWIGQKTIRVYPPDEVTCRNEAAETDPEAVGVRREAIDAIWESVERLYQTGLHPALALCLRRGGKILIDRSIGHVRGNAPEAPLDAEKVAATPNTLFSLFSASKAITAMVAHLLAERQLVDLDEPVVSYLPEFGQHGKDTITLRHILTHRAGIPPVPDVEIDVALFPQLERIIELVCQTKPVSRAGRSLAYHTLTGGFVVAGVVQRVTGRDIRTFLREEVLDPLGFENLDYGVPPEKLDRVAQHAATGVPPFFPVSWFLHRALGVDFEEAVHLSNQPEFHTAIIPSANVICTANEASRFFQLLLNEGELDGVRVFKRGTVRSAVTQQGNIELDLTLVVPVRYTMGFMPGGDIWSLFGSKTPRAFGHLGFTALVAWADPERDIAVSLMSSGKPFISPGVVHWLAVTRAIARLMPKVED